MSEEQMSLFEYHGKNESGHVDRSFTLKEIVDIYKKLEPGVRTYQIHSPYGQVTGHDLILELSKINKLS